MYRKLIFIAIIIILAILSIFVFRRIRERFNILPNDGGNQTNGAQPNQPTPTSSIYKPGNYRESITVDGLERTYLLHIPEGFDVAKRYPLLFGFHGGAGSGEKFAGQTGFREKADTEGFIAVFPDGISHNWNDGRDTTDAYKAGVDDIKFVRTLVGHLKGKLSIDANRVFATGVSNGGIFSHRVACELSDIFAAVGVDVAAMPTKLLPKCNPVRPISVVAIQGTKDPFFPIEGGDTGHKTLNLGDGGLVESAEKTKIFWAQKNGCETTPKSFNLPQIINDGTRVSEDIYTECREGVAINYYIVDGMGHVWPPKAGAASRVNGPTSKNISATDVIWEFFEGHPKN